MSLCCVKSHHALLLPLGSLVRYTNFGFLKAKQLQKYYLNGNDAFRLKLPLEPLRRKLEQEQEALQKGQKGELTDSQDRGSTAQSPSPETKEDSSEEVLTR